MDIGPPFIPNPQAAEAREPGEGALHHPAVAAQLRAALDLAARDPGRDAPLAARRATMRSIVALVGVQLGGSPPRAPQRLLDRGHGVEHRRQRETVREVRRAQAEREREAVPLDQQMLLRARLAAIRRIRAGNFAPLFAGTRRLSRLARDQSISSAMPSRSSSTRCSRAHTPARCQSRSRRQQVTPLPQPISCGSISQGRPVCNTNKIPVKAARSGTRGRPPWGLAGSGGSSGSMTLHSSSLTNGLLMPGYGSSSRPRF